MFGGLSRFLTKLSGFTLIAAISFLPLFVSVARGDVFVHSAASLAHPMEELLKRFSTQAGIEVRVSYGSSGSLARQILAGAPGDIFISAHPDWIEKLKASGIAYEVRDFAYNRLNFVVRRRIEKTEAQGIVRDWERLKQAVAAELQEGRLVTGNPAYSPLGGYALKALDCLGLSVQASSRLIYANNARAAVAFLQRGEIQAGFLYATDARAQDTQTWERFDISSQASGLIRYPIAQLNPRPSPEARKLFAYLAGEDSHEVLHSHGFVLAPSDIPASSKRDMCE